MKILVTGADGFIGKNLCSKLDELGFELIKFTRSSSESQLAEMVSNVGVIFHLAGSNRPLDDSEFERDNENLTKTLCKAVEEELVCSSRIIPLIFSSSVAATEDTPYGRSKRLTEEILLSFAKITGNPVKVLRLPNIFGKECRPNYNSVVATFCYNAINGIPLSVSNSDRNLSLLHIDDLIEQIISIYSETLKSSSKTEIIELQGDSIITLGELAHKVTKLDLDRKAGVIGNVGEGFDRKLFSTYISYLPPDEFISPLNAKVDSRGSFVEFIKTTASGQVSVMRCSPGEIRGRHYHHTKSEQFLVIEGQFKVVFENIYSGRREVRFVSNQDYQVVWAVPGWSHSLENVGEGDAIAVVWANEIFDQSLPDTYRYPKELENGV